MKIHWRQIFALLKKDFIIKTRQPVSVFHLFFSFLFFPNVIIVMSKRKLKMSKHCRYTKMKICSPSPVAHLPAILLAGRHLRHDVHSPETIWRTRAACMQLYYTSASVQRCVAFLSELSLHHRESVLTDRQVWRDSELGQGTVSVSLLCFTSDSN